MIEGEKVDPATIPDIIDVGPVHKGVEGALRDAVAGLASFFGDKDLAGKLAPRVTIEVESDAAIERGELMRWARLTDLLGQIELDDGNQVEFASPLADTDVLNQITIEDDVGASNAAQASVTVDASDVDIEITDDGATGDDQAPKSIDDDDLNKFLEENPAPERVTEAKAKELMKLRAKEVSLRATLASMDMDDEGYWDLSGSISDVVRRQKELVKIFDDTFGIDGIYGEAFGDFEAINDDADHIGHFALLAIRDELVELGIEFVAGLRTDADLQKWYADRSGKVKALRQQDLSMSTDEFVSRVSFTGLRPG